MLKFTTCIQSIYTNGGPTQRSDTEGYDGIFLSFTQIPRENFFLEDIVDFKIKSTAENQTADIISDKKSVIVNNYFGFTYTTQGLGENKYIYLSDMSNLNQDYVLITDRTKDPGGLGFDKTVDLILSTFQFTSP